MAKKTAAKKPRRRLKRTVRRSMAAVFMMTAVVVAAIPVPENVAAPEGGISALADESADKHDLTDYGYKETGLTLTDKDGNPITDDDGNPKKDTTHDEKQTGKNAVPLGTYENATTAELVEALKKKLVYPSLKLGTLGNRRNLTWEFMYYLADDPRSTTTKGVVCKYNNESSATKVTLSETPVTGYYTVEEQKFDDFYSGKLCQDEGANQTMLLDPTKPIKYTYEIYQKTNGDIERIVDPDVKAFYKNYANGQYESKLADFREYDRRLAADDFETIENADGSPSTATTIDYLREPLELAPSKVLDETQKLYFYCDCDIALSAQGEGYRLEYVYDNRIKEKNGGGGSTGSAGSSSGNSDFVYIAYGGNPKPGGKWENDGEGFLTTTKGVQMFAIGNRAFEGVGNVKELELPADISHIGDEAFENASLIERISLSNVEHIGNRAFKNCDKLSEVNLISGTKVIGAECFAKSAVTSVTLPNAVNTVGYGAFADCRSLSTLDLNGISQACVLKDYAFYNCGALSSVSMKNARITRMGKGVFAVSGGALPISIEMPNQMGEFEDDCIGDFMFAGRSGLQSVVLPQEFGSSPAVSAKLPDAMFHGCTNLGYLEFPADIISFPHAGSNAEYNPDLLFADVSNPDLYVRGPETKDGVRPATPRENTWKASSRINSFVPYVFKNASGVDCYEVEIEGYRYQANAAGQLTSCVLVDATDGNLVIPNKVGNYEIKSIAPGCFADEDLRQSIVTLTIQDNSITTIDNDAFRELPKLKKAVIGNSVSSIGERAFEGCNKLVDVTFHSPSGGHEGFTIGKDAFKTGSTELTFHGDIVEGYAPFDWAVDKDNVIKEPDGIRVCYKSLAPTFLTVMYDENTGLVTLLDYPKLDQVSGLLNETYEFEIRNGNYGTYEHMREEQSYLEFSSDTYEPRRQAFKNLWMTEGEAAYDSEYDGPWITQEFCDGASGWGTAVTPGTDPSGGSTNSSENSGNTSGDSSSTGGTEGGGTGDTGNTGGGAGTGGAGTGEGGGTGAGEGGDETASKIADFFFAPIVAYAADTPQPYYARHPFKVGESDYPSLNAEEQNLLYAVENIEVPEGVGSIDVYGYIGDRTDKNNRNANNADIYLNGKLGYDVWSMYSSKVRKDENGTVSTQPGLFSGYYEDGLGSNNGEKYKRGNDRIKSVTLHSVTYLPDYAFDSCENLLQVTLGPACKDIGVAPFRGCYEMETVGDNDYYTTTNGIIYSKNEDGSLTIEECLSARGRKTKVGPAIVSSSVAGDENLKAVSAIKPGAFEDCDDLTTISFGMKDTAGLMEIPEDCFKDCDSLQTVVLPMTTNDIGKGAFSGANSLRELTIYGDEVKISGSAFDADKTVQTTVRAHEDSAVARYVKEYGDTYKLYFDTENPLGKQWQVSFYDANYKLIEDLADDLGNEIANPQYVTDGEKAVIPANPADTEGWHFDDWVGLNGANYKDVIREDTIFYAQGHYDSGAPVNGEWTVEFYDGVDGSQLAGRGSTPEDGIYRIPVGKSFTDMGWPEPLHQNHAGYEAYGFSSGDPTITEPWTVQTVVNGNLKIIALYKAAATSGGSTTISGGATTNTSGGSSNNNSSSSSSSSSSTSSSTSSSSTSTSSTTSDGAGTYTVFVENGSGSGSYTPGTTVTISAYVPADGMVFSNWTTDSNGVTLLSASMSVTTFTMPSNNVSVKANYVAGTTPAAATGTGGGTTARDDGNTRVDIEKPGISNRDLATANVNGSTDNFVVKISETDEATRAVAAALTNKYGTLDNILYYAMDISLYDSTGTTKISDTSGLSVDITIPIPDSLVAYGGNNMAGAVVSGDQLESLNESFTTINGVPCIRFRATHFSPYTIYVDTGNLVEGMLDVTPKTGDPIHPKWFLSLGLACLSIILFLKKDKKVTVKA